MQELKKKLEGFREMLVANTVTDFEFENNANEEFSELATQLQTILNESFPSEREQQVHNLMNYVSCDGFDEAEEMLVALERHPDKSDMADHVDPVCMCEDFEYSCTVQSLLEKI
jgi:predicted translin family RNA/ssDNA-binding protein